MARCVGATLARCVCLCVCVCVHACIVHGDVGGTWAVLAVTAGARAWWEGASSGETFPLHPNPKVLFFYGGTGAVVAVLPAAAGKAAAALAI